MTRIIYLHGFASSPLSAKAQFFKSRLAEVGAGCEIPQLDQGNFEAMTISSQLDVINRTVAGDRVILMGSSLGGYLAALYAARHTNIERLVLLAPAFQFPRRWKNRFTASEFAAWKESGKRNFFHYAAKDDRPLSYGFVEDAIRYEDDPNFKQPALILHGLQDEVVPVAASESFARSHPNVKLIVIESGHELTDSMDRLWYETSRFLGFQKV